jgi:DNA-binding MarR family transcriptional regulator
VIENDNAYRVLNNLLVKLFNDIMELEEKAIITEEFKNITNNDMHVIEAIGAGEGNNMSTIAKKLKITVGSLTTAMNGLVNKKYVVRHRSEEDRRVVYVRLTPLGIKAYRYHEDYHKKMTEAIIEKVGEKDLPTLTNMVEALSEFFEGYPNEKK